MADLLLLVDGRHTIADAIRMSGAGRFVSLVLLADLTRNGALHQVTEEKRAAKAADSVGKSGPIDDGFFDALRQLTGAGVAGLVRATDGRRSKEIVVFWGSFYRTSLYKGEDDRPEAPLLDAAHDFAECLSWKGARWEFMKGTLPPILQKSDEKQREALRLDLEGFLKTAADAGKRWGEIAARVPKDVPIVLRDDEEARTKSEEVASELPAVLFLLDGERSAEDVARTCGSQRFVALSTILDLLDAGIAEVKTAAAEATEAAAETKGEGDSEEEWDLGLG
jgi:hypothetical protein